MPFVATEPLPKNLLALPDSKGATWDNVEVLVDSANHVAYDLVGRTNCRDVEESRTAIQEDQDAAPELALPTAATVDSATWARGKTSKTSMLEMRGQKAAYRRARHRIRRGLAAGKAPDGCRAHPESRWVPTPC